MIEMQQYTYLWDR